jgi:hypothetical protein
VPYCRTLKQRPMSNEDSKLLLTIDDRIIIEEIQRILENSNIFSVVFSDNPASSAINAYMGSSPSENLDLIVNIADYDNAAKVLSKSQYKDLINFS